VQLQKIDDTFPPVSERVVEYPCRVLHAAAAARQERCWYKDLTAAFNRTRTRTPASNVKTHPAP
jgi:hypothetical protein